MYTGFYLFSLFFLAASVLSCSMWDLSLWCTGFSLVVACGFSLSSCCAWAPGHVGSVVCSVWALSLRHVSSVVVVHRLSCPTVCGILVPQPGIEPVSPALEGGFFTSGPPGKSLHWFFSHNAIAHLIDYSVV